MWKLCFPPCWPGLCSVPVDDGRLDGRQHCRACGHHAEAVPGLPAESQLSDPLAGVLAQAGLVHKVHVLNLPVQHWLKNICRWNLQDRLQSLVGLQGFPPGVPLYRRACSRGNACCASHL